MCIRDRGKDVKLRKEIPIAIKECMNHEGIQGALVSHGSSTVPQYIVNEINACLLYTSPCGFWRTAL